jgi:hypothetical protein
VTSYSPDPELVAYRAATAQLVEELSRGRTASDPARVDTLLAERLRDPELDNVLKQLSSPVDAVVQRLLDEVRSFHPNERSMPGSLPGFVRLSLLSQIDARWWDRSPAFITDDEVDTSEQLVDLGPLRARKSLRFAYRSQPKGLPGRARDFAVRRGLPGLRPPTAGLRFARSRPESIAFLNQLAADATGSLPLDTPPFWVTSLVRSEQHQARLRALGYSAPLPSAHCVGQAIDIEMSWYRKFDQAGVVGALLLERQDAGQISVIDEGIAWHVCISPDACAGLRADYREAVTP